MLASTPQPVELLAPAGEAEAMRAAVANGADAVYFGLSNFNARQRAENFTLESLPQTLAYLHAHNVRAYVTVNTLIFSDELAEAQRYIAALAEAGVDAVIVQDLGLARLIHRMAPTLLIHASTQMTLSDIPGIEAAAELGVQRVILARELSLEQIRTIAAASPLPVEVFVHGALCVAYSGQCLTSESIGGRSANRGQCAQACRLPYDLVVDGKHRDMGEKAYLLSPQDLAAYDMIDQLVAAGVRSFKIEGRLKSAHYVAAATAAYRAAIDAATAGRRFDLSRQQRDELTQSFSRGFTHGFLSGVNHQRLVHGLFPKSRGLRLGTVARAGARGLIVSLAAGAAVKAGDGVVFDEGHPEQDEQGGRVYEVRPAGNGDVELIFAAGAVSRSAIPAGSIVWKTDDPALRRRLEQTYSREGVPRRVLVHAEVHAGVDRPLILRLCDDEGHAVEVSSASPLAAARKHPLTESLLREQLGRLGDTPFELRDVRMIGDASVMAPKSVLNDLRRQAAAGLLAARAVRHAVVEPDALTAMRRSDGKARPLSATRIHVLVRTMDQLDAAIQWRRSQPAGMITCDFEHVGRYADAVRLARSADVPVALSTPRICKPGEEGFLRQILQCRPDAVLVRNLSAIRFYRAESPDLPLLGDYSLNVANELSADALRGMGLLRLVPSFDLNYGELAAMLARSDPGHFEVVVHQHMPMFHMEHCVFAACLSTGRDYRDCGRPCESHRLDLRDRVGAAHPVIPDIGCRNTVFNATAQSAARYVPNLLSAGVRHFRIDLLRESAAQTHDLLCRYQRLIDGREQPAGLWRDLRALSQLGVTAGTFE